MKSLTCAPGVVVTLNRPSFCRPATAVGGTSSIRSMPPDLNASSSASWFVKYCRPMRSTWPAARRTSSSLEDRRAVLVVLRQDERAGRDRRQVVLRLVGLEALAVGADLGLPHLRRQDVELLQVRQHVAHRLVVLDDQRVVVRRRERHDVRDERRQRGGRPGLVLQHQVAGPDRVLGRERLAVRPLRRRAASNVHVLPSFEVFQDLAQSPSICSWFVPACLYWTSVGYCMMNASYDCDE